MGPDVQVTHLCVGCLVGSLDQMVLITAQSQAAVCV